MINSAGEYQLEKYITSKIIFFIGTLNGHGNETDFLRFLQKSVRHRSLTLHIEPFDFGFEFAEIFVIEK